MTTKELTVAHVNNWPGQAEVVFTDGSRVEMTKAQLWAVGAYATGCCEQCGGGCSRS